MRLSLLITLALLSGCGRQVIDEEFTSYVTSFEADAAASGKILHVTNSVRFGHPSTSAAIAECQSGVGPGQVVVDSDKWIGLSVAQKEMVIYHELGHCALGRAHVTSRHYNYDDFLMIPDSLMYPIISEYGGQYSATTRSEYVKELFK